MLVEGMRALGPVVYGHSIRQGELESFHRDMCEALGWLWRRWPAVGRELKKLPGVRKGKVLVNGQRLTVYEVGPVPTEAIVDLAEEKSHKRA
jgi:riboflavin synthase alpha subunit